MDLEFKPVQICDLPLAYSFLQDALKISFGQDPTLWPNDLGKLMQHNYIEIIEKKLAKDPLSAIHVWQNGEVIGQFESLVKKDDPDCGYVSLYYLVPHKRGCGLAVFMDNFTMGRLTQLGCKKVELTVEPTNKNALKFYLKQGWIIKGPHPSNEDGLLMEKILT